MKTSSLILIVSCSFLAFFLVVFGSDSVSKAQGSSTYLTASAIGCDPSCHNDPTHMDKKDYVHKAEECTACHMETEEVSLQRARVMVASEIGERPQTKKKEQAIRKAEKKKGPFLVEDQKTAIEKLKHEEMVLPKVKVEAPQAMIHIPAGEFIMGSDERWPDESPEHVIYMNAYIIDKYEVTNAQYEKFVKETGRRPPDHWMEGRVPKEMDSHPVTYVSWHDAMAYCQSQGKRLPLEQEWEKAARGTDGRTYPWGNEWDEAKSNNPQRDSTGTEPVGSYESGKSPYGLYDMSGNVWEWVDAWYKPHPGNTAPSEEYGEKYKLAKGGSWYNCLFYNCGISAPTYNRSFFVPYTKNNTVGVRCAKDIDE